MVEMAASDLCNIEIIQGRCAHCSARRFQVLGASVEADEHGPSIPCQPVGLRVIRGFASLLGLFLGSRIHGPAGRGGGIARGAVSFRSRTSRTPSRTKPPGAVWGRGGLPLPWPFWCSAERKCWHCRTGHTKIQTTTTQNNHTEPQRIHGNTRRSSTARFRPICSTLKSK